MNCQCSCSDCSEVRKVTNSETSPSLWEGCEYMWVREGHLRRLLLHGFRFRPFHGKLFGQQCGSTLYSTDFLWAFHISRTWDGRKKMEEVSDLFVTFLQKADATSSRNAHGRQGLSRTHWRHTMKKIEEEQIAPAASPKFGLNYWIWQQRSLWDIGCPEPILLKRMPKGEPLRFQYVPIRCPWSFPLPTAQVVAKSKNLEISLGEGFCGSRGDAAFSLCLG